MAAKENPRFAVGKKIGPFKIEQYIASGGYGDIYMVSTEESLAHKPNPTYYAMKVEFNRAENQGLKDEIAVMLNLQGTPLLPALVANGQKKTFHFCVMELLGPSLSRMRHLLSGEHYTLYTILHVAVEMLKCIQELHNRGFIHRDIKPGNFLVRPSRENPIVLVDFGLSSRYIDEKTNTHFPFKEGVGFTGTCRYSSINAHAENELSRRDDLISWFYCVIEIANGNLPWPGSTDKEETEKTKRRILIKDLCAGLPVEFQEIWRILNLLEFEQTPPYDQIRTLIYRSMKNACFTCHMYDWEFFSRQQITQISFIPLEMGDARFEPSEEYQNLDDPEPGCKCAVI